MAVEQRYHELLIHSFKEYMYTAGWRHDPEIVCPIAHPDTKLRKSKVHHLIFAEVKPPYASTTEILKGIGECSSYLWRTDVKPYLVLHQDHYTKFRKLFDRPELYWLGIYIYNNNSLQLLKPSGRETQDVLGEDYRKIGKPIPLIKMRIKAKIKEHFGVPRFVEEFSNAKV